MKGQAGRIPKEAKSAMVYLLSSVLSKGLTIITTPIFTRIMPSSQIGVVNVFLSWYTILSGIVSLGLTSGGLMMSLQRFNERKDQYLSSILTITSLSSLLFGLLFLCFSGLLRNIVNLPPSLMVLMFICFLFNPAYDFWLAKQRFEFNYRLSGIIMVVGSVLSSVIAILAVINYPNDSNYSYAEVRLYSSYAITIIVAIIIWFVIFLKGKTFYSCEYWKYSLNLSIPLIGQMVAAHILGFSDRIMIERFCGESQVGIYSTVYTIGTLTAILWSAINGSFTPFIYKNIENGRNSIKKISYLIILMFSLISIIISLFGPEITRIVGTKEYYEGVYIIPPVAAGVYMIMISDLYSDLLIYAQKTKYIMFATTVAAISNIALNAVFIPRVGYIAAAYTTLFSYLIMTMLLIFLARKQYKHNMTIQINEVLQQEKMIIITVVTIIFDLVCMGTYGNPIVRYVFIAICMGVFIVFAYKKNMVTLIKSFFMDRN